MYIHMCVYVCGTHRDENAAARSTDADVEDRLNDVGVHGARQVAGSSGRVSVCVCGVCVCACVRVYVCMYVCV